MTRPLTKKEFLVRAFRVHGSKYSYVGVNYVSMHQKVTIECPEHGTFSQSPANHLSGKGCSACGEQRRARKQARTTSLFVTQAIKKFGQKFDYSKVEYVNQYTDVTITCPVHGDFDVKPKDFLKSPHGCKSCRFNIPVSTSDFIQRARDKNGDLCDYSGTEYTGYNEKVDIICLRHGKFSQKASAHLRSKTTGCPQCVREGARISHAPGLKGTLVDTEAFIERAMAVHNGKYSYEKTVYVNNHTNVIVTCPIHGDFETNPNNHGRKKRPAGCKKCADELQRKRRVFTKTQFIEAAQKVHGGKYSYQNVDYRNARQKVTIDCPFHGPFLQEPFSHTKGVGCPKCGHEIINIGSTVDEYLKSGQRKDAHIYLLLVKRSNEEFLKIGITTKPLNHRFAPSTIPYEFDVLVWEKLDIAEAYLLEQGALEKFKKRFHYWPQLDFGGRSECFKIAAKNKIISFLGFSD